jgi:hypothetical protein
MQKMFARVGSLSVDSAGPSLVLSFGKNANKSSDRQDSPPSGTQSILDRFEDEAYHS